jgi:regulator of protease activity HflC (stomatin/prohibitin superfamily)
LAGNTWKFIPVGYVAILEGGGLRTPQILKPGLKLINPLSEVSLISTRLRDIKEKIETTSSEAVKYDVEVSLQYRLTPEKILQVYETLGENSDEIVISRFRSLVREVTATYPLEDAISTKRREVATRLKERLQESLLPLGFMVDAVLLREVILPENLQQAIDSKIKIQQENEQISRQVEKAQMEGKIKRIQAQSDAQARVIEAKATRETQQLLSSTLTPSLLKLKSIEAAEKIGTSSNARIYVGLGSSKSGELAPLIDQLVEPRQESK